MAAQKRVKLIPNFLVIISRFDPLVLDVYCVFTCNGSES